MNGYTLQQILRGVTNTPWRENWDILREMASAWPHAASWPTLWSPYYGHRLSLLRLLLFADARLLALRSLPLVCFGLSIQLLHVIFLASACWRLFGFARWRLFLLSLTALLHLLFSAMQMENLIWSFEFAYLLVFAAATGAFLSIESVIRAQSPKAKIGWLAAAALCALVSTASMANGLLAWPVLIAQAASLRLGKRVIAAFTLLGTATAAVYLYHYSRPAMGMGLTGALLHPWTSCKIAGMVLGGPFSFVWLQGGVAFGLAGLLLAFAVAIPLMRSNFRDTPGLSSLTAAFCFISLSIGSIVVARISPEWLATRTGMLPLPSRYLTLTYLFWGTLFPLGLWFWYVQRRFWIPLSCVTILIGGLSFGTLQWQVVACRTWLALFHQHDALGAALLLNIADQQELQTLWPQADDRARTTAFLRENRLAVFAEPRASWPGVRVDSLFQIAPARALHGGLDGIDAVPEPGCSWRIKGWVMDADAPLASRELVIADRKGVVIGLARSGLPDHGVWESGWLGYARAPACEELLLYAVSADRRTVRLALRTHFPATAGVCGALPTATVPES